MGKARSRGGNSAHSRGVNQRQTPFGSSEGNSEYMLAASCSLGNNRDRTIIQVRRHSSRRGCFLDGK